ncbi:hypothetical protein LOOC260_107400 [Paucilactobacillus hokkaidonensis JCM 18461]|uniref:Uncharacterized protein n=1 Tax=Paucilactobacillus hokkaidonensis JCM 18461 TaxID=1291742 RepID=A0A0A1GTG3_9LACO|nr:hypothetical protein LOOC260_107400 [Paucilactobacillus hokkaidonensis JCM 18461]
MFAKSREHEIINLAYGTLTAEKTLYIGGEKVQLRKIYYLHSSKITTAVFLAGDGIGDHVMWINW